MQLALSVTQESSGPNAKSLEDAKRELLEVEEILEQRERAQRISARAEQPKSFKYKGGVTIEEHVEEDEDKGKGVGGASFRGMRGRGRA